MESETLFSLIDWLQDRFHKRFATDSLDEIWAELLEEPDDAAEATKRRVKLDMNSFPTAGKLLSIVQSEGKRIRLEKEDRRVADWDKEKGSDASGRVDRKTFLSQCQPTEYGRRSLVLLRLILERGYCQELTDGCLVMATTYPEHAEEWREVRQNCISWNQSLQTG